MGSCMKSREELEVVRSAARTTLLINVFAMLMYLAYVKGFKGFFEEAVLLAFFANIFCIMIFAYRSFSSMVTLVALIIALAAVFLTNISLLINVAEFVIHTPLLVLAYLAGMNMLLLAYDRHITSQLKTLSQSA
jgi:hypothetical protein